MRVRTHASWRGMTLGQLIEEAMPRITNPTAGDIRVLARAGLGDVQPGRDKPEQIALTVIACSVRTAEGIPPQMDQAANQG